MTSTTARTFASTSIQGIRQDLPPMRLWQKAKRLGIWNPQDIDFSQDARDWQTMTDFQREGVLQQTSLFLAGEESVTLDLLPLIMVMADEGRLEDEMYLTSFLWEEAKHVDGFRRFFDEVAQEHSDLSRFHGPSYHKIFYEELPSAMHRLRTDASPVAQVRASVTYNMIVEGVLAETGYHAYHRSLASNNLLPGMIEMVGLLKRDESRHLAYAVYLLSRLVAEHGDLAWNALEERMNELLPLALGVVTESFVGDSEDGKPAVSPFGLEVEEFTSYAVVQFQKRMERIRRARGKTLEEIYQVANSIEDDQA